VSPPPIACTRWLEHLQAHLPVAEDGEDPEGVHQVRVAAARLRVWLQLGGLRVLQDDLRSLRRAAGDVRDLDVLMGMGGPPAYASALMERWHVARAPMLTALRSARTTGLLRALRELPPIDGTAARRDARRWRRRVVSTGDGLDWVGGDEAELHAFRRRVRRLRYALEWTGRPDRAVKALSEDLGDLNDLFVLRERVGAGDLPQGTAMAVEDIETRIGAHRDRLAADWHRSSRALRG